MKLLLTNDDGANAKGLNALYQKLKTIFDCYVVAPKDNQSGKSQSISPRKDIFIEQVTDKVYTVEGTPADAVQIALSGKLIEKAQRVISGINHGANMGDDILYSGTLGGAFEGRFTGNVSIAISLCGDTHFESAATVLVKLLRMLPLDTLDGHLDLLNINVPDLPLHEIKGFKITTPGRRHFPALLTIERSIAKLGPPGEVSDNTEGTDFYAVEQGYISITPLCLLGKHSDKITQELSRVENLQI